MSFEKKLIVMCQKRTLVAVEMVLKYLLIMVRPDIGHEALDKSFNNILNLTPAEGNNPVRLLPDDTNEAKCFPVLFPKGCPTY